MSPDTNDLAQAISAANAPLIRSLDKLDEQVQRIGARIDQLPAVYMSRDEYRDRHRELQELFARLEIRFSEEHRWSLAEHTRLSDQFGKELEEIRSSLETSRGHALNIWIAAGGWIFGTASFVIQHFWK